MLSAAYVHVGKFALGLATIEKALALDPNSARAWLRSGWANHYASNPNKAIEHFLRFMRLSPLDAMHFNPWSELEPRILAKASMKAACWIGQALSEKPSATWVYWLLTTKYANAGRLDEAKQAAAKLFEAFADLMISKAIDAAPGNPEILAGYAQGLREAGLPEQ